MISFQIGPPLWTIITTSPLFAIIDMYVAPLNLLLFEASCLLLFEPVTVDAYLLPPYLPAIVYYAYSIVGLHACLPSYLLLSMQISLQFITTIHDNDVYGCMHLLLCIPTCCLVGTRIILVCCHRQVLDGSVRVINNI
jgi:hypothetical protein